MNYLWLIQASSNIEEYKQFQREVESRAECQVISNFTDYIFDKRYFYGGALHMTNKGAQLRTRQLIKDLQKYLNNENQK